MVEQDKTCISCINKIATGAILSQFPEKRHADQVKEWPEKIAVIRSPLDRLISCYSYLTKAEVQDPNKGQGWESFIDLVLTTCDPHWIPQHKLLSWQGGFLPNVFVNFNDLGEWWEQRFQCVLPIVNPSDHLFIDSTYRLDEVEEKYAEDYKLWKKVLFGQE